MANPETGCTCGSVDHPRECKLHPELYRLHIASLNVKGYLNELPDEVKKDALKAMDALLKAQSEALRIRQVEVERLQRLVFKSNSTRTTKEPSGGFGGASDYEVWLRGREYLDLNYLIRMHTSVIDGLRFRRRFIQHEVERRFLHSSYGKHPAEHLFELQPEEDLP